MADETTLAATPGETTTAPETDLTTKIESPTETSAEPEAKAPAEGETVEAETTEGEQPERKKVPGSQRLKRRLELIEADFEATQRELATYRQRDREAQERANKPDGKPGVDREPKETDFPNDYFAFERAQSAWTARQAVRDEFNRVQEEQRRTGSERVQIERHREMLANYQDYADEVRERIPDFDKVVATASGVQIKPELAQEILSSDKSALLQYHLAKNPEKVRELNQLSGRELAKEIGRLEARVHLPTAKKATEASPPPTEVKGAAAAPIDPRTGPDDMNAYAAWRAKQRAKAS